MIEKSTAMQGELFSGVWESVSVLFERGSALETWGLAILFVLLVGGVYKIVARACGLASGRALLVLVPGFFLMLLAMSAVRTFWTDSLVFQLLGALVIFLVAVLPLTGLLQSSSWVTSLILWAVTLLTAAAIFYAEAVVSQTVRKGAGSGSRFKQRHEQLDNFFKGK